MRQYELTYLISDKVSDADINKVTGKIGGVIDGFSGKILKEEIWKRRKLAYPINKQEFATYVTINIELPGENTQKFERQLHLTKEVIRHLLLVRDLGNEKITLTSDEIAGTADIEKAIGGERSFEAVLGETEASHDLQAVRGSEEATLSTKDTGDSAEKETKIKEEKVEETSEKESADKETPAAEAKPVKRRRPKADPNMSESDRLAKLDEQLDSLLKDDL